MSPTGHGREEGTRGGRDIVGKDWMSGKSLRCSQGQEASSEGCTEASEVDSGLSFSC